MRMMKKISRLLMVAACLAVAVPSAAQSQFQSTFEVGIGYTRPATENMDMVSVLLQAEDFFLETGIGLRTNAGIGGDSVFGWLVRGGMRPFALGNVRGHVGAEFSLFSNSTSDNGESATLMGLGFLVGGILPAGGPLEPRRAPATPSPSSLAAGTRSPSSWSASWASTCCSSSAFCRAARCRGAAERGRAPGGPGPTLPARSGAPGTCAAGVPTRGSMSRSICVVGHLMLPLLAGTPEPVVGGAEVQSFHLAQELHRRGWRLSFLVCSHDGSSRGVRQTPLGTAHILYPRRSSKRLVDKLQEKRALFNAVLHADGDLVFQRAVWDADLAALAARWRGRPYVYSLASDRDVVALPKWSRRRNVLHLARAVVAQTASQREWAERDGVRARIIASGFPVPGWNPAPRADVLWVGTLRALKQPDLFLDLAAAFPSHAFVLCGGAGEDTAVAVRVAARAAALPNLRYEGFVPYAQIAARFARARVLVNTSTYEGFPNTFVLAWLHGAVVLSLGVDPDEAAVPRRARRRGARSADLAAALGALLADESRCAALAARARAHAERQHDIRTVANDYEAVFEAALGGRSTVSGWQRLPGRPGAAYPPGLAPGQRGATRLPSSNRSPWRSRCGIHARPLRPTRLRTPRHRLPSSPTAPCCRTGSR